MSKKNNNHRKKKKDKPDYGNGPFGAPVEENGNNQRKKKKKKKKNDGGFDDIISAEYLQWLEHTAKQAGYDTIAARAYFDGDSREHPEEDFRQCAAEWYDDVKYTFGFDVGWFDMQRRWC